MGEVRNVRFDAPVGGTWPRRAPRPGDVLLRRACSTGEIRRCDDRTRSRRSSTRTSWPWCRARSRVRTATGGGARHRSLHLGPERRGPDLDSWGRGCESLSAMVLDAVATSTVEGGRRGPVGGDTVTPGPGDREPSMTELLGALDGGPRSLVLLGRPAYYRRSGFDPSGSLGISYQV